MSTADPYLAPIDGIGNGRSDWLLFAVLACLIVFGAAYLRVWNLHAQSVDGDELFSRRVAMANPSVALNLIKDDLVHPPLYYFALKATLPFTGSDATGIRILSLVCGIGSVVALFAWGIFLPQIRFPVWVASALLALNNTHLFYSQQARSYALYGFLVCLLILWALVLDRYGERIQYWAIGTVLTVLVLYTHYVGVLFVAAILLSTLLSDVRGVIKARMVLATGIAFVACAPWFFSELPVYRSHHGVSTNVAWQGLPTAYDLRAVWAAYLGLAPFHGGALFSLSVGMLLAGFAVFRAFKVRSPVNRRIISLLASSAVMPPLLLFSTSFKPLQLTVFGERHLLPCIFAWLVLVALGLAELSSLLPRPRLFLVGGAVVLSLLQLASLSTRREPYLAIAGDLNNPSTNSLPVYTTWTYGIAAPVNFYLGTDRVQPLPDNEKSLPRRFVLLYRPAISKEQSEVTSLLKRYPDSSVTNCRYYSAAGSAFGTRFCETALVDVGDTAKTQRARPVIAGSH